MCKANDEYVKLVEKDVEGYAGEGLRTLMFAYKEISEEMIDGFKNDFNRL